MSSKTITDLRKELDQVRSQRDLLIAAANKRQAELEEIERLSRPDGEMADQAINRLVRIALKMNRGDDSLH